MSNIATSPEFGPRILFFSGGTALRATSQALIRRTHNSVHVITPFDSGGSSAVLRKAFQMPAVGDIRNRLMALVDLSGKGARELFAVCTYRFSKNESNAELCAELSRMVNGEHVLVRLLPDEKRAIICGLLRHFVQLMPDDFDLRGASIGNLILSAGYFEKGRRLAPAVDDFSRLAPIRGKVLPVMDADLHLAAELEDGTVVVGQHRLTGKEVVPLNRRIVRVWMTDSLESEEPVSRPVAEDVFASIQQADLICFPIGSFYSSVVANLLPDGVGKAVAANDSPKVFIPNPGNDPELFGHSLEDQIRLVRRYLVASGAPEGGRVLDAVLVDSRGQYSADWSIAALKRMGVAVVDRPLLTKGSSSLFDPSLLATTLLEQCASLR